MEFLLQLDGNKAFSIDLKKGIDLSIPLRAGEPNVNAWYVDPVKIEPVKTEEFVGSVKLGGSVNFNNIAFNPHGNGTHTECVGHISREEYSLNQCLKEFFFIAQLCSVDPVKQENGDRIIEPHQLNLDQIPENCKALIIRSYPNPKEKINKHYSNSNPPYLSVESMEKINQVGIEHLLIDLPSVDREFDEGKLAAHHLFWDYPNNPQLHKSITELIYVPEHVKDGPYLLNLQFASFENDASPSKPVIFPLKSI